jgi:hypothetical protein
MSTKEPSALDELMNEDLLDERAPGPGLQEELAGLKAMVQAQQVELDRLRVTAAAPTDNKNKGVESEAKDLLRKIRFDGSHFSAFKIKFLNVCRLRHVADILEGNECPPDDDAPDMAIFAYEDRVNIAKLYLQTVLTDEVFDMVRDDEQPAEMWKTLAAHYETKEWSNKIYAQR